MTESSSRTLVCSIVFLDIVEYSKKAVADQLQMKQLFNAILESALKPIVARDRVVLDTGDGAAITFLGDPEDALLVGMQIRDAVAADSRLAVRMGINLGPVRLVRDLNSQLNIIGDGINVAQRVMSFARPGQLLVSRSFYEVVSCLSRDYASLFHHEGARTDKHVREHDVYSVVGGTPASRRLSETETQSLDGEAPAGWLAKNGPLGLRRSALLAAGVLFLTILAGGVGARVLLEPAAAPAKPAARVSALPAPAVAEPAAKVEAPLATKLARLERQPAASGGGGNARVELAVAPWGEVLVDGHSRGVSPPLRMLEVPPGTHTVEIRNSTFPAHVQQVQVKAGEAVRIRHRFR